MLAISKYDRNLFRGKLMSFYGVLAVSIFIASMVQLHFFLANFYDMDQLIVSNQKSGTAMLMLTELNEINAGANLKYLGFASSTNGAMIFQKNNTIVATMYGVATLIPN